MSPLPFDVPETKGLHTGLGLFDLPTYSYPGAKTTKRLGIQPPAAGPAPAPCPHAPSPLFTSLFDVLALVV